MEGTTKAGFVYLMANRRNGTLYLGVTNHLVARAYQHRKWPDQRLHPGTWLQIAGLVRAL
ncbi:hypothetical protein HNQ99_002343 [Rhizorhapis suberifaciens]|uniref:GIY-YIG domain-containing protein n=1 Tax=Rhizorhapis suberifaciens TaxID=13656 RepID=A0A840HVE3_9SPHN|nr:hypothetical protein [Rhizorhapis suberifaciens]